MFHFSGIRQLILADNQVIFLHRDIRKNGLKSFFQRGVSPVFTKSRFAFANSETPESG